MPRPRARAPARPRITWPSGRPEKKTISCKIFLEPFLQPHVDGYLRPFFAPHRPDTLKAPVTGGLFFIGFRNICSPPALDSRFTSEVRHEEAALQRHRLIPRGHERECPDAA